MAEFLLSLPPSSLSLSCSPILPQSAHRRRSSLRYRHRRRSELARSPVSLIANALRSRRSCRRFLLDFALALRQRFRPLSPPSAFGRRHTPAPSACPHL